MESGKQAIDTSIKSKIRIVHALFALLSFLISGVDIGSLDEMPLTKLAIIIYLGFLMMWAYMEDHNHIEKTGDYPKAEVILDLVSKHIDKMLKERNIKAKIQELEAEA